MLKRKHDIETQHPSAHGKFPDLRNSSADSRQEKRKDKTTIGKNISIEGDIRSQAHLVIEGSVKGNIKLNDYNIEVGSMGRVEGDINAQDISIRGQMIGDINAEGCVKIAKDADFCGGIHAKGIMVENGARFNGSVKLNQEPHRKSIMSEISTGMSNPQPCDENKILPQKAISRN